MAETIGTRLRIEREKRGLSIDDVAHATRIHATNILGLEADDYSGFANTTYAKSFLSLYSEHLDIDASEALEQFAGGSAVAFGTANLGDVTEKIDVGGPREGYFSQGGAAPQKSAAPKDGEQGGAPIFLGLIVLLVMIAIPTFYFVGKDAESPEEALEKAKELSKGNIDAVVPVEQPEVTPIEVTPEVVESLTGPNPDAKPSTQEAVITEPVVVEPLKPIVAKPVVLNPDGTLPSGGAQAEPIPDPTTPVLEKPKNQFGFPGN